MGKSPFLTLGPSWPFTIFLLCLSAFILVYFLVMIKMANIEGICLILSYTSISINLALLFGGNLVNPGIPQAIIDYKLKE